VRFSLIQTGLQSRPEDYNHQHIAFPVVGIVLNVYTSDHPLNGDAKTKNDFRGSHHEADVLVVNDGRSALWLLPGVVILPPGASGADNYHEELPRPAVRMLDGTQYNNDLNDIDISKIDADWCVVGFIGGSINQPFMMNWWPHPYNTYDPATSDAPSKGYLQQGARMFKRIQGTKLTVTDKGSVFVSTAEANSKIGTKAPGRVKSDDGGDIQIDVKKNRRFEINFNDPVDNPDEPSLPQANPPQGKRTRSDDQSRVSLDKDYLNLISAKQVVLEGQASQGVLLGFTAVEKVVKGDTANSATMAPAASAATALGLAMPGVIAALGISTSAAVTALVTALSAYASAEASAFNAFPTSLSDKVRTD
jgi:hypothetical protein